MGLGALLWGLPAALWLAWLVAWVREWPLGWLVVAVLLLVGALLAIWRMRRPRVAQAPAADLAWHGPMPGQLAGDPEAGFTVDGLTALPRCRLRFGDHLCLSWGADGASQWGWLRLLPTPHDQALKVLLTLPARPASPTSPMSGGGEMGAAPVRIARSVASCEAGAPLASQRVPREHKRQEEAFAPTEIMQEQQGMAFEAGRPHGPAGRRTE